VTTSSAFEMTPVAPPSGEVESIEGAWRALGALPPASASIRTSLWVAVALPAWSADGAVAFRLRRAGFAPMPGHPWLLCCRTTSSPRPVILTLEALSTQLESTRVAVLSSEAEPTIPDLLAELEDPRRALSRLRAQWLVPIMTHRRLACRFQPVFRLDGEVLGEEAFARADVGDTLIGAPLVLAAARDLELLPFVERLLRHEALSAFQQHVPGDSLLFVNFAVETAREPESFARCQVELARAHAIEPARVVFEATRAELCDPSDVRASLAALRDAGFLTALDGLGTGGGGPALVREVRPDFAKLDGRTVRASGSIPFAASLVRKVADAAREVGARSIATGIETTEQLSVATRAQVDGVQGRLLSPVRRLGACEDAA
jgi:EAL domain-containing protein (putative c-di-GMP-specific phosphodiesterase class I)